MDTPIGKRRYILYTLPARLEAAARQDGVVPLKRASFFECQIFFEQFAAECRYTYIQMKLLFQFLKCYIRLPAYFFGGFLYFRFAERCFSSSFVRFCLYCFSFSLQAYYSFFT
jgi:hypothetical protein